MIKHRGGGQVLVGDVGQTNEAKKSPSVDVGDNVIRRSFIKSNFGVMSILLS